MTELDKYQEKLPEISRLTSALNDLEALLEGDASYDIFVSEREKCLYNRGYESVLSYVQHAKDSDEVPDLFIPSPNELLVSLAFGVDVEKLISERMQSQVKTKEVAIL